MSDKVKKLTSKIQNLAGSIFSTNHVLILPIHCFDGISVFTKKLNLFPRRTANQPQESRWQRCVTALVKTKKLKKLTSLNKTGSFEISNPYFTSYNSSKLKAEYTNKM